MRKFIRFFRIFIFLVLFFVVSGSTCISPNLGQGGKIVFERLTGGTDATREIFIMNADGSGQTRLTNNNYFEKNPSFSSDGSKIVFIRRTGAGYTTNADGSNQTRLTNNSECEIDPTFSPDGKKIIFTRQLAQQHIFTINIDGTGEKQLTFTGNYNGRGSFSPDGSKIVFGRSTGANMVCIMNADGSNIKTISNDSTMEYPTFSPDGSKILVIQIHATYNCDMVVMNTDGSGQVIITDTNFRDMRPSFSPDGSKIVFARKKDASDDYEIYVMNIDGSNQKQLTDNSVSDKNPCFAGKPK